VEVKARVVLDEREEAFVFALCRGLPPTRAAEAAGFSISAARHLIVKPHISAALRAIFANLQRTMAKMETLGVKERFGRRGG